MRVLLAEDEKALSRAVATVLNVKGGYEVDAVYDGEAALEAARQHVYDVCILDIMMPKMDGITALEILRREGNTTPVLMLTAKAELDDRVKGLDAGADDYLPKPFQMAELLARLRSLTRRAGNYTPKSMRVGNVILDVEQQELRCESSIRLAKKEARLMEYFMANPDKEFTEARAGNYTPKSMRVGNVILDVEQQELRCESSIRLAKKEARLMEYFMANPDKEFTEAEILGHVWKDEEADGTVVWVYISYLKSKLNAVAADQTIEGETGGPFRLATVKPKEG